MDQKANCIKVNLQNIIKLKAPHDMQWCVLAYVLNRDIIKQDGSIDELYGFVFPLGSFDDLSKAEEHARNIIATTGYSGVIVCKYSHPLPLSLKFDPKAITEVHVDLQGKLLQLESSQYKYEKEMYERQMKLEEDIIKESEQETDPNSIEYFKRQCFLAIKNKAKFLFHDHEAKVALENYNKRKSLIKEHYQRFPNHEKQWLPYLKEKLTQRGELDLYNNIEQAYLKIRDELLE